MEQVLTVVVKLQASPEQHELLDNTAKAFADACNHINTTDISENNQTLTVAIF